MATIINNFLDLIMTRRSCRTFLPKPIDENDIYKILSAAVQAPSSKNIQNWRFVVLENKNKDDIIGIVESEFLKNIRSKQRTSSVQRSCEIMRTAPVLILVFNKSPYINGEKHILQNPTEDNLLLWNVEIQSISASIQNILLASYSLGFGSLWIADVLFCRKKISDRLGVDNDLVSAIAIGYPKCPGNNTTKQRELDVIFRI